jgi:hypothetical protein
MGQEGPSAAPEAQPIRGKTANKPPAASAEIIDVPRTAGENKDRKAEDLGNAREFVDKLEHSSISGILRSVVIQEMRTLYVRQGQPALQAFEGANINNVNLSVLMEGWTDAYLASHETMKARYDRGQVTMYGLFRMLISIAITKAILVAERANNQTALATLKDLQNKLKRFEVESSTSTEQRPNTGRPRRPGRGVIEAPHNNI